MNAWLLTAILFLPPLAVTVFVAMRADCDNRLVAVQFAGGFTALILASMSFAFDQPSFIDLAVCAALLSVPGTYVLATFLERWL